MIDLFFIVCGFLLIMQCVIVYRFGTIDFEEFVKFWQSNKTDRSTEEERIKEAFKVGINRYNNSIY